MQHVDMSKAFMQMSARYRAMAARPVLGKALWWLGMLLVSFVLWIGLAVATVALAQDVGTQELETEDLAGGHHARGWDVTLGGGIGVAPSYDGASKYTIRPIPFASIKYGDLLTLGASGISLNVLGSGPLHAGPVIGYMGGRKESDDSHLRGLGNVSAAGTAGMFATYEYGAFEFEGTARQSVTRTSEGFVAELEAAYKHRLAPRTVMQIGPVVDIIDGNYAQTFFGVTAQQSRNSGLRVYTPSAGVKDVGLNFAVTYRLSDHIILRGFAGVKELVGDAGNSPIVRQKTQGSAGFGAAYHF
jgi:outer membrane protein